MKNLLSIATGRIGGEKKVSEAIIALLKKNDFKIEEINVYQKKESNSSIVVSFFILIKTLIFLKDMHHKKKLKNAFIYTTESIVVMVVHFFNIVMSNKIEIVFHFHGTKATRFSAKYRNPMKLVFFYIDHSINFLILKVFEFLSLLLTKIVIVPSKYSVASTFFSRKKVSVIHSFVDLDIFKPSKNINQNVVKIGYLGRVTAEKGVSKLLKACSLLKFPLELSITHIPGHNDHLLTDLQGFAKKKNITLNVGYGLNQKQVAKFIQKQHILVLPSYCEEFPLSILETLACGKPVVVTKIGKVAQLLSKVAPFLIIDKPDPFLISQAIIKWVQASSLRKKSIKKKAIDISKKYSKDAFEKKVLSFFSKALQ